MRIRKKKENALGWEIHITRADDWTDSQQYPITVDEWLALVKSDPELIIDPRDNGPYFALWLSHHRYGDHPWFDWFSGSINTKNPDRKTMGKAIEIARYFDARVQGDDGEVYERTEDLAC